MQIKIGEFDCTECWDGVFYKKLSNYPAISEWEIQNVFDFEHYEKQNGRDCFIDYFFQELVYYWNSGDIF